MQTMVKWTLVAAEWTVMVLKDVGENVGENRIYCQDEDCGSCLSSEVVHSQRCNQRNIWEANDSLISGIGLTATGECY